MEANLILANTERIGMAVFTGAFNIFRNYILINHMHQERELEELGIQEWRARVDKLLGSKYGKIHEPLTRIH